MIFSKKSWFFMVYCWSKKKDQSDVTGVNLCPFMRTVFIWAPIKFIFYRGFIWKIPVAAIVWSSLLIAFPMWAGMISYDFKRGIYVFYSILAGIALGLSVAVFMGWIFSKDGLGYGRRLGATCGQFGTLCARPFKSRTVTETIKLIRAYITALHDRICPYIEFK